MAALMPDQDGFKPLHRAAAGGHDGCLRALLNSGANMEGAMADGRRALHLAASNGKAGCVQQLLRWKADPSAVTQHGHTALHLAACEGHAGCVQQLLRHLPAGTDIDMLDSKGYTPFLCAVAGGHTACVQAFLKAGANVKATTVGGSTAEDLVFSCGNPFSAMKVRQVLLPYILAIAGKEKSLDCL